jgi:hypothetical protein
MLNVKRLQRGVSHERYESDEIDPWERSAGEISGRDQRERSVGETRETLGEPREYSWGETRG